MPVSTAGGRNGASMQNSCRRPAARLAPSPVRAQRTNVGQIALRSQPAPPSTSVACERGWWTTLRYPLGIIVWQGFTTNSNRPRIATSAPTPVSIRTAGSEGAPSSGGRPKMDVYFPARRETPTGKKATISLTHPIYHRMPVPTPKNHC